MLFDILREYGLFLKIHTIFMHVYGLPSEYFFIQNSWLLPPSVELL